MQSTTVTRKKYSLDFSQLPNESEIPYSGLNVWSVPEDIKARLKNLQETTERCEGTFSFLHRVVVNEAGQQVASSNEIRMRERFLRAALAEYVSYGVAIK